MQALIIVSQFILNNKMGSGFNLRINSNVSYFITWRNEIWQSKDGTKNRDLPT